MAKSWQQTARDILRATAGFQPRPQAAAAAGDRAGHEGFATPVLGSGWLSVPAVARAVASRIYGGDHARYRNLVDYGLRRWGGKLPACGLRILCLGCTETPSLESMARDSGRAGEILVVDPDERALERAAARGCAGVKHEILDWNVSEMPAGPFHLVIAHENLHRVAALEHLFDEIARVLDPVGLFLALEYIGPNRLQYGPEQMAVVNALLGLLPERLRQDANGEVHERHRPPELGDLLRLAPDLAVRSEDLIGVFRSRLDPIETIQLGGSILAPLLAGISGSFIAAGAEVDAVIRALIETEEVLVRGGLLRHDYGFAVGRKPAAAT